MTDSPKQLSNCLKSPEPNIVLIVLYGVIHHYAVTLHESTASVV